MRHLLITLAGLCLLTAGCQQNSSGLHAISGEVTLDGQPLATGTIQLEPMEKSGSMNGALIQNGKYQLPSDKGMPPGKYRVRISSPDETKTPPISLGGGGPKPVKVVDRFPPVWNTQSQKTIEVVANGKNQFDFHAKSSDTQ